MREFTLEKLRLRWLNTLFFHGNGYEFSCARGMRDNCGNQKLARGLNAETKIAGKFKKQTQKWHLFCIVSSNIIVLLV